MSPSCYTCKHCKGKGHLAKDCPELAENRQRQAETFERDNAPADLLLVEEEGEEEGADQAPAQAPVEAELRLQHEVEVTD